MRIALALTLALAPALAAHAEDPADLVAVEVLPGWTTPDGHRMAALRLTLAPGWKTYWRSPGAAGIPPEFRWDGAQNIGQMAFHWPVPQVFHLNGMQSIGYTGQVVIPVEITPAAPGAPMRVAGVIDLGVCHDICVPVSLPFDLLLPEGGRRDPAIAAALVDRPLTADEAGVLTVTCAAAASGEGLTLTARIELPPQGGQEVMVIESGDPGLWVSEAATWREGGWLVAEAAVLARDGGALAVDRSALRLTVIGDGGAVDIHGCGAG